MIYWLSHGKNLSKKKWEVNKGKLPLLTSHFIFWALISLSLTIREITITGKKLSHLKYIPHDLSHGKKSVQKKVGSQ